MDASCGTGFRPHGHPQPACRGVGRPSLWGPGALWTGLAVPAGSGPAGAANVTPASPSTTPRAARSPHTRSRRAGTETGRHSTFQRQQPLPPGDPAFDANGDLWLAGFAGGTLVEYTTSQLAATGAPTPGRDHLGHGGSLNGPTGLAFDATVTCGWRTSSGNTTSSTPRASWPPTGAPTRP